VGGKNFSGYHDTGVLLITTGSVFSSDEYRGIAIFQSKKFIPDTTYFPDHLPGNMLIFHEDISRPCMHTGFGFIEINGVTYTHDIVIHTDGTITKREKKKSKGLKGEYGHTPLSGSELDFLAGEKPKVIYIGTGQYGSLPLTKDAEVILGDYKTVVQTTPGVISALTGEKRHYVAILHVTC
jgi:hypothetical protein